MKLSDNMVILLFYIAAIVISLVVILSVPGCAPSKYTKEERALRKEQRNKLPDTPERLIYQYH